MIQKTHRQTLMLATALTLLTACSTDTLENERDGQTPTSAPVAFDTYVSRQTQTRASGDISSVSDLQDEGAFFVIGCYTGQYSFWNDQGGNWTADKQAATKVTANALANVKVTWDSGASEWTYSPVIYWPNNIGDKMTFFAWAYPGCSSLSSGTGGKWLYHSGTIGNSSGGDWHPAIDGVDGTLLYADSTNMTDLQHNVSGQQDVDHTITDKVTFNFKHAGAALIFRVRYVVDEVRNGTTGYTPVSDGTTVTLNSITLQSPHNMQVSTTGWFSFSHEEWNPWEYIKKYYSNSGSPYTENNTETKSATLLQSSFPVTYALTTCTDKVPVIIFKTNAGHKDYTNNNTVTMTNRSVEVAVNYTVYTQSTDIQYSKTNTVTATIDLSDDKLQMGQITYVNLYLGLTSVQVEAEIGGTWDSGTTTDKDVDEPANQ